MKLITHNNKILINSNNNILTSNYISAQPSKIFIGSASNVMYYSLDNGVTWTQKSIGSDSWTYLGWTFFSGDGNTILIIGYNTSNAAYLSQNGGLTWSTIPSAGTKDALASINYDGTYALWGGWNNTSGRQTTNGFISTNSVPSPVSNHLSSAISDNGQYQYIGRSTRTSSTTKWFRSIKYGSTFTSEGETGMANDFTNVNCDSTGQYVAFHYGNYDLKIWFSNDYGQTATQLSIYNGNFFISNDANYMLYNEQGTNKIFVSTNKGSSWNSFTSSAINGANVRIKVAKTRNRGFYYEYSTSNNLWEVDAGGTSSTLIQTFAESIRFVECGDNHMAMITTDKKLYLASYDDVTSWSYIYTFPGATSATYLAIK